MSEEYRPATVHVTSTGTVMEQPPIDAFLIAINDHTLKDKFPTFSGRDAKSKDCSFNEWYYIYKKIIEDSLLSSRHKEMIVFNSLVGEARQRYIRLDNNHTSKDSIITKFVATYSDNTTSIDHIEKFNSLRQGAKESISEYADHVGKTAYWVATGDDEMKVY